MDNRDIVEKLKKNAKLASAFVKDHPNSNIRTVDDFYHFVKSNPGIVEGWMHNQSDIPFQQRTIQELASSFHVVEQIDEAEKFHTNAPQNDKPSPQMMGIMGGILGSPVNFMEGSEVKLAEKALQEPAPEVNLTQFVPTEIQADKEFQAHLAQAQEQKIADIKAEDPNKKYSKHDLDELVQKEKQNIEKDALERYAITSDKAEKVRTAREKDIYLKDDKGRVIGERIFTDKKNNPEPYLDPVFRSYQLQKQAAIQAALEKREADKKNGIKPQYKEDQLKDIITFQYDGQFAAMFPEKAAAYAKHDYSLDRSLTTLKKAEKKLQKKDAKAAKKEQAKPASQPPPPPPPAVSPQPAPQKKDNTQQQQQSKNATSYQQMWNKKTLENAIKKGYDRSALAKKIRDFKVWKTRTWQQGQKAIKPIMQPRKLAQRPLRLASQLRTQGETSGFLRRPLPRGGAQSIWRSSGGRLNSSLGKKLAGRGAQKAASAAGKKAAQQLAQKVVVQGVSKLAISPPGLIAIGVVVAVILIFCFVLTIISLMSGQGGGDFVGGGPTTPGGPGNPGGNPIPNFTLSKTASATTLPAPEEITYTISYSNLVSTSATGQAADPKSIIIYDIVPENTTLIVNKTTGKYNYDTNTNIISWALSDPENSALNSFSFVVLPGTTDIIVTNKAWATATEATTPNLPPVDGDTPPTADDCNGYYTGPYALRNPVGNFGDPNCSFAGNKEQAMSQAYDILKTYDPDNADYWYTTVIPCESLPPWNPNSHSGQADIGSPDAAGVWGLFSMGRGLNGEYDHGDVAWPKQISNAMEYANMLRRNGVPLGGHAGGYWECWKK